MGSINPSSLLGDWLAERVRFTGFYGGPPSFDAAKVFASVFGLDPQSQSKEYEAMVEKTEATKDGVGYALAVGPVRLDITITASADGQKNGPFPHIGNAHEVFTQLKESAKLLLHLMPECNRFAIGGVALLPRATNRESYEALKSLLKFVEVDVENSSELIYRINRPRTTTVARRTMKINRLSTWAAVVLQMHAIATGSAIVRELAYAARVELDLNTHKETNLKGIAPRDAAEIIDYLALCASEILASGDLK